MAHFLHSDIASLTIYPEYAYIREDTKLRTSKRTKDGSLYVYNWGNYNRFKIPVNYLTGSEALLLNEWWTNDTPLSYVNNSGDVFSSYITNSKIPVAKIQKPYQTPNRAVIELESS